jgi:hypothetical protein
MQGMDPRSHRYRETRDALIQLAVENGIVYLDAEAVGSEEESMPLPPGFTSREKLASKALLPGSQFANSVRILAGKGHEVDVVEYTTDRGKSLRVCDLRLATQAALKGARPQTEADQTRLDDAFMRDAKIFADNGTPRNNLSVVPGVFYTKVSATKLRSYWMPVRDEGNPDGVRTIARIGDCGNGVNYETMLHRRLFANKL